MVIRNLLLLVTFCTCLNAQDFLVQEKGLSEPQLRRQVQPGSCFSTMDNTQLDLTRGSVRLMKGSIAILQDPQHLYLIDGMAQCSFTSKGTLLFARGHIQIKGEASLLLTANEVRIFTKDDAFISVDGFSINLGKNQLLLADTSGRLSLYQSKGDFNPLWFNFNREQLLLELELLRDSSAAIRFRPQEIKNLMGESSFNARQNFFAEQARRTQ